MCRTHGSDGFGTHADPRRLDSHGGVSSVVDQSPTHQEVPSTFPLAMPQLRLIQCSLSPLLFK